jgi:hypothetical protein
MTISQNANDPADAVERGEAIYRDNKDQLEAYYRGQYVAINILNGRFALGQSGLEAIDNAKKSCGSPFVGYLRGIGFVEFFGNV